MADINNGQKDSFNTRLARGWDGSLLSEKKEQQFLRVLNLIQFFSPFLSLFSRIEKES